MKNIIKKVKGFTLIELLIVIAIIGVLSALLMANFIGIRQRARDAQRKADLRQVQSALELYRSDNSSYPSGNGSISTVLNNCSGSFGNSPACSATYMQKLPSDPLGGSLIYSYSSGGTTYTLFACLENASDSQKDASKQSSCTTASFTVTNP